MGNEDYTTEPTVEVPVKWFEGLLTKLYNLDGLMPAVAKLDILTTEFWVISAQFDYLRGYIESCRDIIHQSREKTIMASTSRLDDIEIACSWCHKFNHLSDEARAAVKLLFLEVIGEDEVEYSNLDGDAGYWEKHGRNEFRNKQRQLVEAL